MIGCNEGSLPYNGATEKKVIDFNEIKAEPVTTIEEERRLFYVAMTRARNRLYLCVPQMKNSRKLKVSRFIKETGSRVKKESDRREGVTEVVSFKKEEGMYENCFSNFVKFQLIFEEAISGTQFI